MVEKVYEMRSDARDNRLKIIAAATDIIEQQGTMASLNEISKRAGIGPGTLYRHFPTRDELLAEVLVAWVGRVEAAADATVISSKADLVVWLECMANISNAYRGLAATIADGAETEDSPLRTAHAATLAANDRVFAQARAMRLFDGDLNGDTLGRLVTGVAMVTERSSLTQEQTREMLHVILEGLLVQTESKVHV